MMKGPFFVWRIDIFRRIPSYKMRPCSVVSKEKGMRVPSFSTFFGHKTMDFIHWYVSLSSANKRRE